MFPFRVFNDKHLSKMDVKQYLSTNEIKRYDIYFKTSKLELSSSEWQTSTNMSTINNDMSSISKPQT